MKRKISEILKEISDYLEFKGENVFKVKAYREASKLIENLPYELENLEDVEKLRELSGIGETILSRIREIIENGESLYLEELKRECPLDLEDLVSIPGLGIKKIKLFYDSLGIKNIDDLKDAIYSGKLLNLPRVGKKVIENIKKGIEFREKNRGFPFPLAFDIVKELMYFLSSIFSSPYITGELRRKKEFIRSFDFLLPPYSKIEYLSDMVDICDKEEKSYYEKVSYRFRNISGIIYMPHSPSFFWHTLFCSTGSLEHVYTVLQLYKQKGISFWDTKLESEGEIYKKVELPVIPPLIREGRDEIAWYRPSRMLSLKDLNGEFHVHSVWSDGRATIGELLEEASLRGYKYIGISDHSASLGVAGGLSPEKVEEKEKEIMKLRRKKSGVFPLFGAEVDIKPDGTLDYPDNILKKFDYVIAAIHTNFGLSLEENTRRIISAFKNPYVVAFAHPTGRELGIRPGYNFDKKEVFKEAEKDNILLEINGTPRRMDLDSYELSKLKSANLKFILSSDAHHLSALSNIENSVVIVNKAGVSSKRIVNTYGLEDVLELFSMIREKKKNE